MRTMLLAGLALALTGVPGVTMAQEGTKYDCVVSDTSPAFKMGFAAVMNGEGDDFTHDFLDNQLNYLTDACVTRHAIADVHWNDYFDYSVARMSREWLINELARVSLSTRPVDQALDFGPGGSNPDLTTNMTNDHIMTIVQAYVDSGVKIDSVDSKVWEKVRKYAVATSIYWNKRKLLPF